MAINYNFVDPGEIQDKARARLTSMFDERTRLTAGKAQAAGDYTSAANTLAGGGLTDEAQKTRTYGQALADDTATREGLGAYVAGDYAKSREAFARGGSLPGVTAADAGAKVKREEALQVALKLARAIKTDVEGGKDPAATFDKAAPLFATLFPESATEIPKYRDAFIRDPAGTAAAIEAATAKEMEAFTLGQGQSRYGPDGKLIASVAPEQKWQAVQAGGMLVPVPQAGGAPISVPGAAPASGATPAAPKGGIYDQVAQVASSLGAQPAEIGYLQRLAQVESAGNADAKNGSSTGLFQFQPATFAGVGGQNINDPADQTKAALALARKDREALQSAGLPTDDATVYLMHQQGAAGGRALLTAPPEVGAIAALTPAYGGNAARARQAVLGNGGSEDMTAGEFAQSVRNYFLTGKLGGGGGSVAAPPGTPPGAILGPPKPGYRMATAEEKRANQLDPEQPYQVSPDGQFSKLDNGAKGTAVKLPPGLGITEIGDGFYRDKLGRIYQPNSAGILTQSAGVTDQVVQKTAETIGGINELLTAVDAFDQATKALSKSEIGPTGRYLGDPAKYAAARAAATNLMMLLKGPAAYNLGVITGPDLQLLEGVVENPDRLGLLVRQGQILPKLQVLSAGLGSKYAATKSAFDAQGGLSSGLPDIYRSPHGKYGPKAKTSGGSGAGAWRIVED